MKTINPLILSCCLIISMVQAQDPIITTQLVNRNVYEQDGYIFVSILDAPSYVYGENGESILTGYQNSLLLIVEDTTGTTNILPLSGVSLFPNPTYEVLLLQREDWNEDYQIEIFNMAGISFHSTKWPAGVSSFQFNVASWPQGSYVVSVSSKDFSRGSQYKVLKR